MYYAHDVVTGCPHCGVPVFEHQGKHYTPLQEFLLSGDLFGRNRDPEFRRVYVEHICKAEDLERYERAAEDAVAALKQLAEDNRSTQTYEDLQKANDAARDSQAQLRETAASTGMSRDCPRCGAPVGSPCENLLERRRGNTVPTKNPHDERTPLPGTVEAAQLDLAREETAGAYGLVAEIQEALKSDRALETLIRLAEHR